MANEKKLTQFQMSACRYAKIREEANAKGQSVNEYVSAAVSLFLDGSIRIAMDAKEDSVVSVGVALTDAQLAGLADVADNLRVPPSRLGTLIKEIVLTRLPSSRHTIAEDAEKMVKAAVERDFKTERKRRGEGYRRRQ